MRKHSPPGFCPGCAVKATSPFGEAGLEGFVARRQ